MKSKITFLYPLFLAFCVVLLVVYSSLTVYANHLLNDGNPITPIIWLPRYLLLLLMGAMWMVEGCLAARAAKPVMLATRFVCVVFILLWSLHCTGILFPKLPVSPSISNIAWAFAGFLIASTVALLCKKKSE